MWQKLVAKLASRKFWMAVVSAALIVANQGLDLGIPEDTVLKFVYVVLGWIFSEGLVDAARAYRGE